MRRAALALLVIGICVGARAQGIPEDGGHELGLWVAGGHSVPGGTKDTGVMDAGLRYGWILTKPHLPGPLRGTFEYAVDAIPLYLVMHDGTTYGGGFNPLVLKWNFVGGHKVAPFVELAGGTLFTTRDVPRFTSAVNFRSGAALGIHIFGSRANGVLALRYEHISNAGLASPNPGINTVQVQLGINTFSSRGRHGRP
jgi:hypothetical protein